MSDDTKILGDFIGFQETLEDEFKEFILKVDPSSYFESDEIGAIVTSGVVLSIDTFNTMIHDNIRHYFEYYVPRYVSVFANSKLERGKLYIGVSDVGEITGIPFFGDLRDHVDVVNDYLSRVVRCVRPMSLVSSLRISIKKVGIDVNELSDTSIEIIDEYTKRKADYVARYTQGIADRKKWLDKLNYYSARISDYANTACYRVEIAEYVRSRNHERDDIDYVSLSDLFMSDTEIHVGNGIEIGINKVNMREPMYWITQFKDFALERVHAQRPERVLYVSFALDIYESQFMLLSGLRRRLCENMRDIQYFVIEIDFPTDHGEIVSFRSIECDRWNVKTRAIVSGTVGCM